MSFPAHLAELESRLRARFEAAIDELRGQYEARLRQASDELVAAVGQVTPTLDPLAELEISDLELTAPGRDRTSAFGDLLEAFRGLDRSATQAEALDSLLAGALRFAARSGLLLVRTDSASGWGSAGFEADPFAGRELAWSDDLLGRLASGRGTVALEAANARRFAERLGLARAGERAVLIPLVLRDRIAAVLYADASGEDPLEVDALQMLALAAASRIELQALTSRGFTPTLYDANAAPGAGLELWTGAAPPAAAAPRAPAGVPEEPPAARIAPPAAEPTAPEQRPVAMEPAAEDEDRASVETLFTAEPEPEPEPEPEAWVAEGTDSGVEVEPEPEPETDAGAAGFEIEPEAERAELDDSFWGTAAEASEPAEIEAEADDAAGIEAAPAAPLGEATVRIPAYREPEPPAAEAGTADLEPTAAPLEGISGEPGIPAIATEEIQRAEPKPQPAPDEDETVLTRRTAHDPMEAPTAAHDVSEDATVLTRRADVEVPEPSAAPPERDAGEDTVDRTASRTARSTEVAPPPDVRGPGLAFGAARAGAPVSGENALHDEARRLARLLVSEIKLYNEEQVLEGRRNRDLYIRLREDIDRSRQIYDERVHESVSAEADYFHQELVRSLAGGDSRALGM